MKARMLLIAVTLMVGMFPASFAFGQGFLGETAALIQGRPEAHLYVAIAHTTEAIESGEAGEAGRFADHARAALIHAQKWAQLYPNRYTNVAIANLRGALTAVSRGDLRFATANASRALMNLEATRP
ncbi:MAG: small metal-binding protein SmbP [Methylocystis sp.]|uniref:small metal-binding protein SmbP n=1 Tax=Methylocystis sp. TaxID=1911079 RepID=UPI003DA5AA2B